MTQLLEPDAWLVAPYRPIATYFSDSDCVEYVNEDTVSVYARVDEFLTLIYDETQIRVIGFKLKGFRYFFERLRTHLGLNAGSFIRLTELIEVICSDIGEELFSDDKRQRSYQAARKIAEKEHVELWDFADAA